MNFFYQHIQNKYIDEEENQNSRILFKIIVFILCAYIAVLLITFFWHDPILIIILALAIFSQLLSLFLLAQGYLRSSSLLVVTSAIIVVSTIATFGQGIHDLSLIGYPVIIIFASLLVKRKDFILISVLALLSIAWLVFGEIFDLFTPIAFQMLSWTHFAVVAVILVIAIIGVDTLAGTTRRNLIIAKQEIAQRRLVEDKLRYQSTHDILTNLYNRTFFEEELTRFEKGRDFPVSIFMADLDGLKKTNDTYGHAVGDKLLQQTAAILAGTFRTCDILARVGGDEFAVLLPKTGQASAAQVFARIQSKTEEQNAVNPDLDVSISIGFATAAEGKLQSTMIAADQKMYEEKLSKKRNNNEIQSTVNSKGIEKIAKLE